MLHHLVKKHTYFHSLKFWIEYIRTVDVSCKECDNCKAVNMSNKKSLNDKPKIYYYNLLEQRLFVRDTPSVK